MTHRPIALLVLCLALLAPQTLPAAFHTGPDLVASGLNGPPEAIAPGTMFAVSVITRNQGAESAGTSSTRFYLSIDTVKGSSDIPLAGGVSVPPLASEAPFESTINVTVPVTAPTGPYHVLACADDTLKVAETDETNNCVASSATIAIAKPDLVMSSLTDPPSTTSPAATFQVATTVTNSAPVTAGATKVRFYFSTDTAKSGNDLSLSGNRSVAALAAGAASSGSTSLKVPISATSGSFYLLACADADTRVIESNENNCLASATRVSIARPDLTLSAIGDAPAVVAPGVSFAVTDTAHNPSTITVPQTSGRYYLSIDAARDVGDVPLSGKLSVPGLSAGTSSTATRQFTSPAATPLGNYHLIGCVDDPSKVNEVDEANNCRVSPAAVLVTRPDLVTADVLVSAPSVLPGGALAVSDTVENEGGFSAGSSTTRYYLSPDETRDAADVLLSATRAVSALQVGQTSTGTKSVTVPANTPLDRYFLLACADDLNKWAELDDANNCSPSNDFAVGPPNARPIARAGNDSDAITPGVAVALSGDASTDGDGEPLTYTWTLLSVPPGSAAALSAATSVSTSFTPDMPGQYVVQLVVDDGHEASLADALVLTTGDVTRFVAMGDTGRGDEGQYAVAALLRDLCARNGCDFVTLLGDNIYSSGVDSANDPQFATKFEQPYDEVHVPFYVVLGNHDYGGGGIGDEFYKAQFEVDYTALSSRWRMPAHYYRFTAENVEIFGLDTNMQMYGQDAQQRVDMLAWLKESSAPWKITLGHHPYRSNGPHGNAGSYNNTSGVAVRSGDGVKSFTEEVACGRADLMLSGHDHSLQWLQPNGTCVGTELIVSGAGSSPSGVRNPSAPNYNEVFVQSAQLGFVYVVITSQQLTAEFVGASGLTLYVRTISKMP